MLTIGAVSKFRSKFIKTNTNEGVQRKPKTKKILLKSDFPSCPTCKLSRWVQVYKGPLRSGAYPKTVEGQICRCKKCGLERLAESKCLAKTQYVNEGYRKSLNQTFDPKRYCELHKALPSIILERQKLCSLFGKQVADIGCGGGALFHLLGRVRNHLLAIEPSVGWSNHLIKQGYQWYPTIEKALKIWAGTIDFAFAIQVIEHVENPVKFLKMISSLLSSNGRLILTTPNKNEILMKIVPKSFKKHFYRCQHRWYFNQQSLEKAIIVAGLKIEKKDFIHRYGIENIINWIIYGCPQKKFLNKIFFKKYNKIWKNKIEKIGEAETILFIIKNERYPQI